MNTKIDTLFNSFCLEGKVTERHALQIKEALDAFFSSHSTGESEDKKLGGESHDKLFSHRNKLCKCFSPSTETSSKVADGGVLVCGKLIQATVGGNITCANPKGNCILHDEHLRQFSSADNRVRCAKCNNPFQFHHTKYDIKGKWYHTGCFKKIGAEMTGYAVSDAGSKSPSGPNGFVGVPAREEWEEELNSWIFDFSGDGSAGMFKDSKRTCIFNPHGAIKDLVTKAIQTERGNQTVVHGEWFKKGVDAERSRLRAGVENLENNHYVFPRFSDSSAVSTALVYKSHVLKLIDNNTTDE